MSADFDRFTGTDKYIVSPELKDVVNVSIALGRPLLVKGEPGTGKTLLGPQHRQGPGKEADRVEHQVHHQGQATASTSTTRCSASMTRASVPATSVTSARYIHLGQLSRSFSDADERVVLLIDEVDKADIEFPNDLLNELDEMSFHIPETDETVSAKPAGPSWLSPPTRKRSCPTPSYGAACSTTSSSRTRR